ncbi:MAG: HNH endonuclease [SAR324 cluster bacterium]|nr:HNH endonuclease [SAR324 cluster bacterium]
MRNNPDLASLFDLSDEAIRREKQKASDLRQTQWWKNRRACNQCYYCQLPFPAKTLTMDHVVPLSRGGKSTKSNLVPCCKECNNLKKNLLPLEWEHYLQRLRNQSIHDA